MKTVIQVVQHLRPGGIETMALDLSSFCRQEDKALIVSLEGDRETAVAHWPRLAPYAGQLVCLEKDPGLKPSLILKLSRLFKQQRADVIHTHHIGPLLYAGLAARLAGVKQLIHTEHDAWHLNDPKRRSVQHWIIKLTRPLLIADAQTVADAMKNHLRQENIKIIRNGIDTERFKPGRQSLARDRLGLPRDISLIGCSGRLEEVKGQQVLIDALANLSPDTHLALAGHGSTEQALRQQAQALGIADRVHFVGHLDEMPVFYQALDAFCLPSRNEGMPLAPLEAQACNILTVVTDVGGSRETLCPFSGKLIPGNDPDAMADALDKILKPPKYRANINPRRFIQQQCDVRLMARAYADLHHAGA